jgi:hypothetical protein
MRRLAFLATSFLVIVLAFAITACESAEQPTATPAPTGTPTPTASVAPTLPPTIAPTPTPAPATKTPALTPSPGPTATPMATATPYPGELTVGSYRSVLLLNLSPPYYSDAVEMLQGYGYSVESQQGATSIGQEVLADYGIVIVEGGYLSADGISLLEEWVRSGGSALFLADPGLSARTELNSLLSPLYGIKVNNDQVKDPDHLFTYAAENGITTTVTLEHPITQGISELAFFTVDGLPSLNISDGRTTVIVEGEEESFSVLYSHNPPLAAAAEHAGGRVVVVSGSQDRNYHTFGDRSLALADNEAFLSNIIGWLAHSEG